MAVGPGKYDDLCAMVRKQAKARCAIVILIDGNKGSGFSCQADAITLLMLPEILERLAQDIRASNRHNNLS